MQRDEFDKASDPSLIPSSGDAISGDAALKHMQKMAGGG